MNMPKKDRLDQATSTVLIDSCGQVGARLQWRALPDIPKEGMEGAAILGKILPSLNQGIAMLINVCGTPSDGAARKPSTARTTLAQQARRRHRHIQLGGRHSRLLESLFGSDGKHALSVVVVDNASSDNTCAVISDWASGARDAARSDGPRA